MLPLLLGDRVPHPLVEPVGLPLGILGGLLRGRVAQQWRIVPGAVLHLGRRRGVSLLPQLLLVLRWPPPPPLALVEVHELTDKLDKKEVILCRVTIVTVSPRYPFSKFLTNLDWKKVEVDSFYFLISYLESPEEAPVDHVPAEGDEKCGDGHGDDGGEGAAHHRGPVHGRREEEGGGGEGGDITGKEQEVAGVVGRYNVGRICLSDWSRGGGKKR